MKISLASAMGTCFGVQDAINLAMSPEFNNELTIVGQLVHNPQVSQSLKQNAVSMVPGIEDINKIIENASKSDLKNIIGLTYDPIVSSDVVRSTLSGLVDGLATMGINNKKIKLIIWFDNGWGYAARIVDTVKKLGQVL